MKLVRAYQQTDFTKVPVDIMTFIQDPEYLGNTGLSNIYPYWVKALIDLYPTCLDTIFNEVLISGACGTGRTTLSIVGFLYDLYRVTMLTDPQGKWALNTGTPIVLSVIETDNQHSYIKKMLLDIFDTSPYFQSLLGSQPCKDLTCDMFPHNVGVEVHTNENGLIGKAVIGSIIDTYNITNDTVGSIMDIYLTTYRRRSSRFISSQNAAPTHMWIVSSAGSPLEKLIDSRPLGLDVIVYRPSIWDVQSFKGIYCGEYFYVSVGSIMKEPAILSDVPDNLGNVIRVPVEYRKEFEKSIYNALQDLAGIVPPYKERNDIVEFNVSCTMKKRWANQFIAFLECLESYGRNGCSRVVAFYADGDGDFKPRFSTDLVGVDPVEPKKTKDGGYDLFDAG